MKAPLYLATTTCLCLLFTNCGRKVKVPPPAPRPVITHTVAPASKETTRRFSGQVVAAEGTGIAFEVNGRVIEVLAKAGKRYDEGVPLARINDTDYRNQLSDAQAQFTNAEQELRRIQRLYESENASQSQLDAAIAQEQSAQANFRRAQKGVDDCILRMPYTGVIGRVDIEPQQVIAAGQSAMTIQGDVGLEFEIGIPAEDVASLAVGMTAEVTLGAFPDERFEATVSEVSPEVANNTTYPVTLALGEQTTHEKSLRPGLDGEAALSLPNPSGAVLRVPSASVAAAPDGSQYVWIVRPIGNRLATVTKREVKTSRLAPKNMIEITEGVVAGDVVVMRGVHRLNAEMTVALED